MLAPVPVLPLIIDPVGALSATDPFALTALKVILPLAAIRLTLPAPPAVMPAL
jgi:hypothetical protein